VQLWGLKFGFTNSHLGWTNRPLELMRYVTHDSVQFEIPEEWLVRSGLSGVSFVMDQFVSDGAEAVINIREISSPVRKPGVTWFHMDRMLPILKGIALSRSIPAIDVDQPPDGPFPYRVRDGFHRYYASVLTGFRRIPVKILPYFDINTD
jgi:hypothetical protein